MSPDVNYKLEISKIGGIELLYPDNSVAILPDYCISRKELTVLYIYFCSVFGCYIILNFDVIHVLWEIGMGHFKFNSYVLFVVLDFSYWYQKYSHRQTVSYLIGLYIGFD